MAQQARACLRLQSPFIVREMAQRTNPLATVNLRCVRNGHTLKKSWVGAAPPWCSICFGLDFSQGCRSLEDGLTEGNGTFFGHRNFFKKLSNIEKSGLQKFLKNSKQHPNAI